MIIENFIFDEINMISPIYIFIHSCNQYCYWETISILHVPEAATGGVL